MDWQAIDWEFLAEMVFNCCYWFWWADSSGMREGEYIQESGAGSLRSGISGSRYDNTEKQQRHNRAYNGCGDMDDEHNRYGDSLHRSDNSGGILSGATVLLSKLEKGRKFLIAFYIEIDDIKQMR